LNGTKVENERWSTPLAKFSVKSEKDAQQSVTIIKESKRRPKEAIKKENQRPIFQSENFRQAIFHQQLKKVTRTRTNTGLRSFGER